MNETPKKIIDSGEKCFLCSATVLQNNKVYVFGKSGIDIPGLIKTAIVDVNKYSESDDLFICKNICYKLLLKFKGASEKLQRIKSEIRAQFESNQLRTKRLLRSEEKRQEEATRSRQTQICPSRRFSHISSTCKASKSLQFSDNGTPTAYTSSSDSNPDHDVEQSFCLHDLYRPSLSQLSNSNPCGGFVFNALPAVLFSDPAAIPKDGSSIQSQQELPSPCSTSTPNPSAAKRTRDTSGKVKLTIHYPCRTVNKTLDDNYGTLGKALFYGPPSRIATAVMKCDLIRKQVIQKVLGIISREVSDLCSKKKPSMLRKSAKDDLMKFNLELLCEEWKKRAPLFYSFLLTSCATKSTENVTWLPSVAISGSVLLKQRNGEMNATANVLGILLKTRSTEANLARFTKLKLTCSNRAVLAKLDNLGENHDITLQKAQKTITHGNVLIQEKLKTLEILKSSHTSHAICPTNCAESILKAKNELNDMQQSSHPGFIIAFDNIDIQLQRKSMTLSAQNRNFHWVNHKMVNNRVSGCQLAADGPKADLLEVQNLEFFPSIEDHQKQRFNYIILVSRMLVEYFDAFEPLKKTCVQHIPHKYTNEMSQKSTKVHLQHLYCRMFHVGVN